MKSKGYWSGKKLSDEHRRKLSESHKGKKLSSETKQRISLANQGRKITWADKISEAHKNISHPWLTGREVSAETRLKISNSQKGQIRKDKLSYSGLHIWLSRNFEKPDLCDFEDGTCKGPIDWANIDGNYVRDIEEFMPLCRSHHIRYDRKRAKAGLR